VELTCEVEQANSGFAGAPTTIVDGQTLGREGSIVYLQGHASEGVVSVDESSDVSLDNDILDTVDPTGQPC
jgi:hypothetical protein